jgi:hypothetical protein
MRLPPANFQILEAANNIDYSIGALNGFFDLIEDAKDDKLVDVRASGLYFLLVPIRDKLERATKMLEFREL